MGPFAYVQHLMSGPRLPFTAAYLGSLGLSLYFALGVGISTTFRADITTDTTSFTLPS
jgi:Got1/Sft2-like family